MNRRAGYIDLSKRRVSPEDIAKCEEKYTKSKMVHSILRHVAEKTKTPLRELYETIGWPLHRKYGHTVDAFKLSITNPDVWSEVKFPTDVIRQELQQYISRRLTPQPTKVRADVEVTCFGYEGINAIKVALKEGEECSNADTPVKVKLVSAPLYVLTSQCLDKQAGIDTLQQAITAIEGKIKGYPGGNCTTRMAPKAVTESDDAELAALMEKRERENQEVSGDDDESASDEGAV